MTLRTLLLLVGVCSTVFVAGCYVDPSDDGIIVFHGNISTEGGQFWMNGTITHDAGSPTEDSWEDIEIVLADAECRELQRTSVGTLQNASAELPVSISYDQVPLYVIISSPTVWGGETDVDYYEIHPTGGYSQLAIEDSSDLPEGCESLVN